MLFQNAQKLLRSQLKVQETKRQREHPLTKVKPCPLLCCFHYGYVTACAFIICEVSLFSNKL